MKYLPRFIFITISLLFLNSCSQINPCGFSKDAFLANYNNLIAEVSQKDKSFSESNWKTYDNRFRTLIEDCYDQWEEDMSFREQRKFWGSSLKYYYNRYGDSLATELLDENNEVSVKIQDELDEIWGDSEAALKDILNDLGGDEVKDLLKDISKDIEKWGEKLEEIFK